LSTGIQKEKEIGITMNSMQDDANLLAAENVINYQSCPYYLMATKSTLTQQGNKSLAQA